jgi:hypothetical protein
MRRKQATSQTHVHCYLQLILFGKQQRVELIFDAQRRNDVTRHNEQVKKNRWVLRRCIDALCFLAKEEFPFRARDVSSTTLNSGNFMESLNVSKIHFLKIV